MGGGKLRGRENILIHRALRGRPQGATTLLQFPSAPETLFKEKEAPFLTLRVATPLGAPRQTLLDQWRAIARYRDTIAAIPPYSAIPFIRACYKGRNSSDTERPKRRFSQQIADSPLLLEVQAFGGRRKPKKTEDFRRKPQETADWALSP